MSDDNDRDDKKSKKIKLPDGYTDEADFLHEMRELFMEDWEYDRLNREAAIEDAKFVAGDQWDDRMKRKRIRDKKPIMTVNRLPAYIGQVVGNRRLNQTSIKFAVDQGGTKEIAECREGLTRSIEKTSNADRAYDAALQSAAIGGLGVFGVSLQYADDDVFEQDIHIDLIANPLSVLFDRHIDDPTGADAERGYKIRTMSRKQFNRDYPDAMAGDITLDTAYMSDLVVNGWVTASDVRVIDYWRMRKKKCLLALMQDGAVVDVTDKPLEEYVEKVELDDDGEPYIREKYRTYAQMYTCTAVNILTGPYNLPIKRVPLFRVPGYEIDVSERKERFGIVRFAKDPQRMHNYWRSVIVEKLMQSPKANWVASDVAIAGYEKEWRNAHLSNDPLLVYNGEAGAPPTRTQPAQIEPALIQEANMASQDIRDVTNMHEASMGQQSNEVSGRAIRARQQVGELGTVVYTDNLNMAIEEAGKVINDLIPTVYDTRRKIKTLGEDMKEKIMSINDPDDPNSIDITSGKYSTTVITGPSYATKRMEASDSMLNMTNAMPETMAIAADLIIQNQDWPGADEIAKRLRRGVPPNIIGMENLDPEEQQQIAAQNEAAKAQQDKQDTMLAAQMEEQVAKTREANARAAQAEAQAYKIYEGVDMDAFKAYLEMRKVEIAEFEAGGRALGTELESFFKMQAQQQPKPGQETQP